MLEEKKQRQDKDRTHWIIIIRNDIYSLKDYLLNIKILFFIIFINITDYGNGATLCTQASSPYSIPGKTFGYSPLMYFPY